MKKYYGRDNKGFAAARANRTNLCIRKRVLNGETVYNSLGMAKLMDSQYGDTHYADQYRAAKRAAKT